MKIKILQFAIVLIFFAFKIQAQKNEYPTSLIADSLKENANAVVRLNQMDIIISSQRSMNVKTKRIVTVFNENGLSAIDAFENYDKKTSVKNIEVKVIDGLGNEIKKKDEVIIYYKQITDAELKDEKYIDAYNAERRIKKWSRKKKEALFVEDWDLIIELARNRQVSK